MRLARGWTSRRGAGLARQRGVALVVALVLLVILTMLAFAGANTASVELAMAGNEQFRRNAALAAAAGIEQAIARLAEAPTVAGSPPMRHENEAVPGSADRFSSETRYVGEESSLPQFSQDEFVGLHYVIESSGASARGATDRQRQGLFVVAASGGAGKSSFGRMDRGLP